MRSGWAGITVAALVGMSAFVAAPAANAAPGDGTLTVTVVNDVNKNSTNDGEPGLAGVELKVTDAAGTSVNITTDGSGVATLAPSALVGGKYRIDVVTPPDTATYAEAKVLDGHAYPQFAPTTSFVDLSGGPVSVSIGYVDVSVAAKVSSATLYGAVQPNSVDPTRGSGVKEGLFSTQFNNITAYGVPTEVGAENPAGEKLGSLYGIGVDTFKNIIYAGAYAKRGSDYGVGGAGAIYRVDPSTTVPGSPGDPVWGDPPIPTTVEFETYVTLPGPTTAHDLDTDQDLTFRPKVGRESLGDVELSDDNRFLLAVNMYDDSVYVYPIQDAPNPAPLQVLPIPPVNGCASDWAPMAIGKHEGKIYIGATCGATMEASVIEYTLSPTTGQLTPTGKVWTGDPTTAPGSSGVNVADDVINGCGAVDWQVWHDTVPQTCLDEAQTGGPIDWRDVFNNFSQPQPMLSDMEFNDDGTMVLAFRDRGADQYGFDYIMGENSNGDHVYGRYIFASNVHTVTAPANGGTLDFASHPDWIDTGRTEAGSKDTHPEGAYGGIATIPGSGRLVTNQMSPANQLTSGLRVYDPETGAELNPIVDDGSANPGLSQQNNMTVSGDFQAAAGFGKAGNLADLELFAQLAEQQIGNRIWIDADKDGVQDPGEPPVAGVQVSLYDADGNLIATTETDVNGEYYFGTSDGVQPNTTYQVRLDRAADFADGGPLAGLSLTTPTAGDPADDSNGVMADVGGTQTVVADVTTGDAEVSDHSIDFGFIVEPKINVAKNTEDEQQPGVSGGPRVVDNHDLTQAEVGVPQTVTVTITNTGAEPLVNLVFTDETLAGNDVLWQQAVLGGSPVWTNPTPTAPGVMPDLTGVELAVGQSLTVTGTLLVAAGEPHEDKVTVNGDGKITGEPVDDNDSTKYTPPQAPVSIGDYVWYDHDRDGTQDAGEPPAPNIPVKLYAADGTTLLKETTTDADGYYSFTDLTPSTEYVVEFVKPGDYSFTTQNAVGVNDDVDSDADPVTGRVPVTTPASGDNLGTPGDADDPTIDAGLVQYNLVLKKTLTSTGKVYQGSTVTFELTPSNDGPSDALAGWSVTEVLPEGMTLVSMTGDGYSCEGATCTAAAPLAAGASGSPITVTATVDSAFVGELVNIAYVSPAPEDVPETNPLDVPTGQTSDTPPTNTVETPTDNDAEAPIVTDSLVSIGDYVWIDTNRDGVQDAGEAPVPGVTVKLYGPDGTTLIATTVTDEKGFYSFTDLTPGSEYVVEFVKPAGYTFTGQNSGADDTADSDADLVTGRVRVVAPATGNNSATVPDDPTIDAGLVKFNLTLTKTLDTSGVVAPGDTVSFTLLPHNDGPTDALAGWSVTDLLPAGLTLTGMSGPDYVCELATATCQSANVLPAGADGAPITVTATVDAGVSGGLRNIAYVTPGPGDIDEDNPLVVPTKDTDTVASPTDNDAEAPLTVTPPPPALPNTGGATPYPVIGAGVGLLLLGAGGIYLAGRRRREHEDS